MSVSSSMATRSTTQNLSRTKTLVLPDLVSYCTYKLRYNRYGKQVNAETKKWFFKNATLMGKRPEGYDYLKVGLFTSMSYPDAAYPQLRVVNDFLTYLFHLDDLSDDMDNMGTRTMADEVLNSLYHPYTWRSSTRVAKMTRDYYKRFLLTASNGTQQRFISSSDLFFQSITQEAWDRATGVIPDLEHYIVLRRDTSGCKTCWAMIEYAYNLDIPEEVMNHPSICNLEEAANDFVAWSNDIFSFNVERSKGHTHNMIAVIMNRDGIDLQSAVDLVGVMCKKSIDRFEQERSNLPSWGSKIDRQVAIYVDGLANWIIGSLHWSFETERYFGKAGRQVKVSRIVDLLPTKI